MLQEQTPVHTHPIIGLILAFDKAYEVVPLIFEIISENMEALLLVAPSDKVYESMALVQILPLAPTQVEEVRILLMAPTKAVEIRILPVPPTRVVGVMTTVAMFFETTNMVSERATLLLETRQTFTMILETPTRVVPLLNTLET